jgi:hypothetical protein
MASLNILNMPLPSRQGIQQATYRLQLVTLTGFRLDLGVSPPDWKL